MKSCVCWTACPKCLQRGQPRLLARALTCEGTSQLNTKRLSRSCRAAPATSADGATAAKKPRSRKAGTAVKPPLPSVSSALSLVRMLALRAVYIFSNCTFCTPFTSTLLVQPSTYQQTVQRSFTVGGLGLHTGDHGEILSQCLRQVGMWLCTTCYMQAVHLSASCLASSGCAGSPSTCRGRALFCTGSGRCVSCTSRPQRNKLMPAQAACSSAMLMAVHAACCRHECASFQAGRSGGNSSRGFP